jgi:uncharacterized protein DUF2726
MGKKRTLSLSLEQIENLYDLYWETSDLELKFVNPVEEIVNKFGISHINQIVPILKKYDLGFSIGTCEYCFEKFKVFSRTEFYWYLKQRIYPCRHDGLCKSCNLEAKRQYNDYCEICVEKQKKAFEEIEEKRDLEITQSFIELAANAKIEDFNEEEIKILSFLSEKDFSVPKISFALKCSIKYAEKIILQVQNKGGFCLEKKREGLYYKGINENLLVPKFEKQISFQIIPSPLAQNTFEELIKHFPYVFPEVVFSSFVNFDSAKDYLDGAEKNHFFTKRLDFLCCGSQFEAIAAIEYNGKHHFYGNPSQESRNFKQKMCELVGIPFIEINSPQQIEHKINTLMEKVIV